MDGMGMLDSRWMGMEVCYVHPIPSHTISCRMLHVLYVQYNAFLNWPLRYTKYGSNVRYDTVPQYLCPGVTSK